MIEEILVPIVICTTMFALIFGIVYLRNRENMALIEKGMNPRTGSSGPRPFIYLKYGLLLVGAGLGLLIAYLIDNQMDHKAISPGGEVYYKDNPAIYFALIGVGGGLGLVISFLIEKKFWMDKRADD
jgi:hypothetical protein